MTSSLHYSFVFDVDQKGLLSILKCKVFNLLSFYILISQIFSEDFGFRRFSSQPLIHPDPIFFFSYHLSFPHYNYAHYKTSRGKKKETPFMVIRLQMLVFS